jgi:hypothetical protein
MGPRGPIARRAVSYRGEIAGLISGKNAVPERLGVLFRR